MRPESFQPEIAAQLNPEEATILLEQLTKAAAARRSEDVQGVRQELARLFPDQLEMVEAIADFPRYLKVVERLAVHKEKGKERQALIREQAEYNFLLTHLVGGMTDRKSLRRFWDALGRMAQAQKKMGAFAIMRAGVLGQVATYKIFQRLGQHPELSHPSQDQYEAIDLWEASGPVQVKSRRENDPQLIEVDRLGPTNIMVQRENGVRMVSSDLMRGD